MITIRPSDERGNLNFGWLDTKHTFSFGSYYDPRYTGFGNLLVINEDIISPSKGFGTHGHQDMEIVTYVIKGVLAHKDSIGNEETIPAGEVQRMSAGTGIKHSEYNHSSTDAVHLLQIWIIPDSDTPTLTYGTDVGFQISLLGFSASSGGSSCRFLHSPDTTILHRLQHRLPNGC